MFNKLIKNFLERIDQIVDEKVKQTTALQNKQIAELQTSFEQQIKKHEEQLARCEAKHEEMMSEQYRRLQQTHESKQSHMQKKLDKRKSHHISHHSYYH